MKISYNWLKEYIQTDLPPQEVSDILTDTGLEVEGLEEIETIKGGLKGVVIGQVKTCEQHPNADKLKVTTVDVGGEEALHIVCGASNVATDQKVLVATVGTTIYTEKGDFKIKKSKLRGEVSEGMICAEDELGLGQSHEGIMVLPDDAKIGQAAADYFNIESDYTIEIGLTPNRMDAMSHYGVARDLRAALLRQGKTAELNLPSVSTFSIDTKTLPIDIVVEDTDACPRYAGVSVKGVKVGPSPDWLQNKLRAIGLGPVNNIVDVTNFVLHETGHPLHGFDADKISGQTVYVKHLAEGTKFTTLDEKERIISKKDLMICDTEGGMVIAGVFGGIDSGVTERTTNVFIESAYFNPVSVRKTAKRHGLNTDASFRYERGVDPNMTIYALKRAAILIREIAGGEIAMDIKDIYPKTIKENEVRLNLERMNDLIGKKLDKQVVMDILTSLDIRIKGESAGELVLSIPTYRADVTREADVVEEVLRIYGFNNIEIGDKMHISVAQNDPKSDAHYRHKISEHLSSRGFTEIMNNSLTKAYYFEGNGFVPEQSVQILNPLSQDLKVMRQSLLFGGLEVIAHNANRQRPDLKLYEFGKTYTQLEEGYGEAQKLSIWVTGQNEPENWKSGSVKTDFYHLRVEVESILASLGLSSFSEDDSQNEWLGYGLSFKQGEKVLASIGKIASAISSKMDVKQDVFYAELNWDEITRKARKQKIAFKDLPKYPEVRRDLALLLDKEVKYSNLKVAAEKAERKILRGVNLFDVYEGKNLPEGKKSYALSFTLRDDNQTLNDQVVEKTMDKILGAFQKEFAAELR